MKKRKKKISAVISKWLVITLSAACAVSMVCTYLLLLERTRRDALNLVSENLEDVVNGVYSETMDEIVSYSVMPLWSAIGTADLKQADEASEYLENEIAEYDEIAVVRDDGLITASSVSSVRGKNVLEDNSENLKGAASVMKDYLKEKDSIEDLLKESSSMMSLDDTGSPRLSFDGKGESYYFGVTVQDWTGILVYSYSKEAYMQWCTHQSEMSATHRHIGREGYFLIIEDMRIVGGYDEEKGYWEEFPYPELLRDLMNGDSPLEDKTVEGEADIYGVPSYYAAEGVANTVIMAIYPKSEAHESMYLTLNYTLILEIAVFAVLLAVIMILEKKLVINDIHKVNRTLNSITQGDLRAKADVRSTFEFDALSNDINATVDRLKDYIAEAEARIDEDLEVAKEIQTSVLPNVFPPFPDRHEFELFASMVAAKEVGGDFYDFYMLNDHTLGFLIADVSGKSIPGAMFMMRSKSVIKTLAESGIPANEVFTEANEKLCEGNDADMFLTAWMGYLDLDTGTVHVANAGHNPPVLIRDGRAEYVIQKHGLMLAGMEDTIYREQLLQLQKGDILFLYTDGVTEAMDAEENLYGEDRLLKLLSFGDSFPKPCKDNGLVEAVCDMVSADVDRFVQGAEQSDDITMLCVRYLGRE